MRYGLNLCVPFSEMVLEFEVIRVLVTVLQFTSTEAHNKNVLGHISN